MSPPFVPVSVGGVRGGDVRKQLTPIARRLRREPTEAEKHLWQELRLKRMGVKFRRQAVIGPYIVDFVSFEKKLVIEVDGGQHSETTRDRGREEWLKNQGFEVLRFWNNEVIGNLEGVFEKIENHLSPPPYPSPQGGGSPRIYKPSEYRRFTV